MRTTYPVHTLWRPAIRRGVSPHKIAGPSKRTLGSPSAMETGDWLLLGGGAITTAAGISMLYKSLGRKKPRIEEVFVDLVVTLFGASLSVGKTIKLLT